MCACSGGSKFFCNFVNVRVQWRIQVVLLFYDCVLAVAYSGFSVTVSMQWRIQVFLLFHLFYNCAHAVVDSGTNIVQIVEDGGFLPLFKVNFLVWDSCPESDVSCFSCAL